MIELKNVSTIFDDNLMALGGIDLKINQGEFVSLVGPSGAGKSTLLRLLTREIIPHEGEVILDGVNLATLSNSEVPLLRRKIGTVYQDFKLLTNKNSFENVAFAMEVCGADKDEVDK